MKIQSFKEFVNESHEDYTHYMFFQDVETLKRLCDKILAEDFKKIDKLLANGHDWAASHAAEAKSKIGEVASFLMNELGEAPIKQDEPSIKVPDKTEDTVELLLDDALGAENEPEPGE